MTIGEFWLKLKTAIKSGVHRFFVWFQLNVKPDLIEFLEDNKALAMEICLEVATDLADEIGRVRFDEAARRLGDALTRNIPNVRVSSSWINILIEIAVQVLKAQGKI